MSGGRPVPTEHGTTGYQQYWGCHCEPCSRAMHLYRKRLGFDQARGRSRRVPVGPIREHVQRLVEAGATAGSIAKATNRAVTHVQVGRILDGTTSSFVLPKTARALLGVSVGEAVAGWGMVSTVGLRRRVEALHAIGYTKDEIGEAMGHTGSFVCDLCSHDMVMRDSLNKVIAAYESLVGKPGTSELQRWRAIREGWAPPMAWEDEALDDPEAEPHWDWVRCAGAQCNNSVHQAGLCQFHYGRLRRLGVFSQPARQFRIAVQRHCGQASSNTAGLIEDLAYLKAQGLSPRLAARQIGRGVTYVEKIWSQA